MRLHDALLAIAALSSCQCKRRESAQHGAAVAEDLVPRRLGPIKLDGEWDEEDWAKRARRGQFVADDGSLARPSSEARFLRDDTDLIVALYAADENIESSDAFDLAVGSLALHIDSSGKVTPPTPGVRTAVDYDEGTRDNAADDDEEWVVELAIPLAAVGLQPGVRVPVRASRCDVPKDHIRRCASWSSSLTVD